MKKELIAELDPTSPISEIFRTLRTNIQFMTANKDLKTILITSTLPGEGKSWVSANLAVTFAQAGKKVIIVDADMRKGRQHAIFDIPLVPGLSNYLSGMDDLGKKKMPISNYIRETQIENLSIITAGIIPPNPSELLVSEKANEMMRMLRKLADIIIFDGTPSLLVTDALILSRLVDSTIIVTAQKETKIDNLNKVKKAIENVGGKIAGVVLNKNEMTTRKYQESYYYGPTKITDKDIEKIQKIEKEEINTIKKEEVKQTATKKTQNKKKEEIKND